MVGADDFVAIADIGTRTEKERAVVGHALKEIIGVAREHLHMFRGNPVGLCHHFVQRIANDDFTALLPGDAGDIGGGEPTQQFFDGRR